MIADQQFFSGQIVGNGFGMLDRKDMYATIIFPFEALLTSSLRRQMLPRGNTLRGRKPRAG